MRSAKHILLLLVTSLVGLTPIAWSQTPAEITRGLTWLQGQVQADGTLNPALATIATQDQARAEALHTLSLLAAPPSALVAKVAAAGAPNSEYMARRAIALAAAGQLQPALVTEVMARQTPDGGIPAFDGYLSDPLDTAFALLAQKTTANADAARISRTLTYLTQSKMPTTGWGANEQDRVYITAYVMLAASAWKNTNDVAAITNAASDYLLAQRTTAGQYVSTLHNALGLLALAGNTNSGAVLSPLSTALKAAQSANGSWGDDPYVTAVALRALLFISQNPPAATTGEVIGTIVDDATGLPLADAIAQIVQNTNFVATTPASGAFAVTGIPAGAYTLKLSRLGYDPKQANLQVVVGQTINMGTVRLKVSVNTASLSGVIKNSSGTAISGVLVAAGSATALTDVAGKYQIAGIAPGAATIAATHPSYVTVNASVTFEAGKLYVFSPTMYTLGVVPPAPSLKGKVIDSITNAAIAGATVTLGAATRTTAADGTFTFTALTAGAFSATVAANTYQTVTLTGTLVAGVNDAGNIALSKPPATSTITGFVTDSATNAAVPGAAVAVQGTALIATTAADGKYSIAGIVAKDFTLAVTATGYFSSNYTVSLTQVGAATVDLKLTKVQPSGITLEAIRTNKPAYGPSEELQIEVDLRNTTANGVDAVVEAQIIDSQNSIALVLKANAKGFGAEPPNLPLTLTASSLKTIPMSKFLIRQAAGTYTALVKAYDINGLVIAEGRATFVVNGIGILGGGLIIDPPLAQAGTNVPVRFTAEIGNIGNQPIPAGDLELVVTVANPDTETSTIPQVLLKSLPTSSPIPSPRGLAKDTAGNVYTINASGTPDGRIFKIDPTGQVTIVATIPSTQTPQLKDITRDSSGNFWIGATVSRVFKVTPQGAISVLTLTQVDTIYGIDIDASGTLFVTGAKGVQNRLVSRTLAGVETVLFSNGLNSPVSMVRDLTGNLVVSNSGDGTLTKINSAGQITPFVEGLASPQGLTIDAAGTFYVATSTEVVKISPSGVKTVFATGLSQPQDVKLDPAGNLFVSNAGANSIIKISPAGLKEVFATGIANGPEGIAYDSVGNLYIANADGTLRVKNLQNDSVVVATGLAAPKGVAIDASGAVLVVNQNNGSITKHVGTIKTTFATGLLTPVGIAIEPSGSMLVSEAGAARLTQLDASGAVISRIDSPLVYPTEVRIDGAGSTYVTNSNFIEILDASGPRVFASAFSARYISPDQVNGGLVALRNTNEVYRFTPSGVATVIKTLTFTPYGIGVDSAGNILLADLNNKRVQKLDAAGNVSILATLPTFVRGLVSNLLGEIFVYGDDFNIYRVNPDGTFVQTATILNEYAVGMSTTSDNKILVWTNNSRLYSIDPLTSQRVLLKSVAVSGATRTSSGQLLASFSGDHDLVTYDSAGVEVSRLSGFTGPRAVTWTGSDFMFVDGQSNLFKISLGGRPVRVAKNFFATYLSMRNGVLHGTYSNTTLRWTGTTRETVAVISGVSSLGGIASLPDGTLTVADYNSSRVISFNTANTIVNNYAGLMAPRGLAFDTQGRLYVASPGNSLILRFDATGRVPSIFANSTFPQYIAFDAIGDLWATLNNGIARYSPSGVATPVATAVTCQGIVTDAIGVFCIDRGASRVLTQSGQKFVNFAAGLVSPVGVRVRPDGSLVVANSGNGTVVELINGKLDVLASDLYIPTYLDIAPDGRIFVLGVSGITTQISTDRTALDLNTGTLLANQNRTSVAVRPDSSLLLLSNGNPGSAYELTITQPVAPPPAGTVAYRTTRTVSAIEALEQKISVDFGAWLPPYGGDFKAEVQRVGTSGVATNYLHVGSFAQAKLTALKDDVPPGEQAIPLQLKLTGADFTSLSRVEVALIRPTVSISFPTGMTGDKSGNVWYTDNSTVKKVTPGGVTTTVVSGLNAKFGLAFDSLERLYLPHFESATGRYQLLRVLTDGTKTVVADLGTALTNGLAVNSRDEILVGSTNKLMRVNPDSGAVSVVTTVGLPEPRGIAIDAKDNVYVQNERDIVTQIKPDGSVATIFSKSDGVDHPKFEGDGYPNIAADCAENFYIAPAVWTKIGLPYYDEEHILAQVVPRTGKIAALFDGLQISASFSDIDYLSYDRFQNRILAWNHTDNKIWTIPVTCGAISVEAHVLSKPGQTLTGFSTSPTASILLADGRTEYVWSLKDVTASGFTVGFDTLLKGLTLGETRTTVDSGYIAFKNSFSTTDVKVPFAIPSVRVGNLVTIGVTTDKPEYAANTTAAITTTLNNVNTRTVAGLLTVDVLDAANNLVIRINQEGATIPASGQTTVTGTMPIGTILPAIYTVRATLTDANVPQASANTTFGVLPDRLDATAKSRLTVDKLAYNPSDVATIGSRAISQSSNLVLSNLTLSVQVTTSNGTILFTKIHLINQLLAGTFVDFSVPYAFQNLPTGTYTVTQILNDAAGRTYDTQTATFTIGSSADTGFGLTGTIAATPKETYVTETFKLDFTATNTGNTDLTAVPLKVTVVDPVTNAVLGEFPATVNIVKTQTVTSSANWVAAGTEGSTLVAVLTGTVGTRTLTLAQTNIKLLVCPAGAPTAFTFTAQTGVAKSTLVVANTATIAGLICRAPISITGGEYSINGGAFTTAAGFVKNGNIVTVRQTSSAQGGVKTTATLTVGVLAVPFEVTTKLEITTPDPFAFTPQVDVPVSSVRTSNTVTITGISAPVAISIVRGEYSINGGAFTSVAGTVKTGDTVTVRQTSSATGSTKTTATLTVGTLSAGFDVTTKAGVGTPDPFTFTPQVDVPLSSERTSNTVTITGITSPVPISITGGTYSINGGAYTAAAGTVKSGDTFTVRQTSSASYDTSTGATLTVATVSSVFVVTTLKPPKPTLEQLATRDGRVLVLVSCPPGNNADACAAARATFLDTYLTGLNIEHKIVTTTEAFRNELRCGRYNIYWISGGALKLKDTLAEEVREAAYRGDALIVDGEHDQRNGTLDEIVGVNYKGKLPQSGHPVIMSSSFLPMGTFTGLGSALKSELAVPTATAQARFDSATGEIAIVANNYGLGKGLLYGFDLVDTLMAQPTSALLKSLVSQGIGYVAPAATTATTTGGYLTLQTKVTNTAVIAQQIEATVTLPAGAVFVESDPATTERTATTLTWRASVPANSTLVFDWSLRAPTTAGDFPITTVLNRQELGAYVAVDTKTTAITVKGAAALLTQLNTQIPALAPTSQQERQSRDRAATSVQSAQTKRTTANYDGAISDLIGAGDDLDKVTSVPVQPQLLAIDQLIQAISREWCGTLPVCPVMGATPTLADSRAFIAFADTEQLALQGGASGNSNWEWALGIDTSKNNGATQSQHTWVAGKSYDWKLTYNGAGSGMVVVKDGATTVLTNSYTGTVDSGLRVGNALRFTASASAGLGVGSIEAIISNMNAPVAPVTVATLANNVANGKTVVYYVPPAASGLTVDGSVKLNFTGTVPAGSALSFKVNAGNLQCRAE